jgi:hypothetical protein
MEASNSGYNNTYDDMPENVEGIKEIDKLLDTVKATLMDTSKQQQSLGQETQTLLVTKVINGLIFAHYQGGEMLGRILMDRAKLEPRLMPMVYDYIVTNIRASLLSGGINIVQSLFFKGSAFRSVLKSLDIDVSSRGD